MLPSGVSCGPRSPSDSRLSCRGARENSLVAVRPIGGLAIETRLRLDRDRRRVNITRCMPQRRQTDDEFRLAWAGPAALGCQTLEEEAARRAFHGTLKPIYHQGIECGRTYEYSDALLMFLLRAHNPGKYRDSRFHVEGMVHLQLTERIIDVPPEPAPEPGA
jgi:hypothetical protein